VKNPTDFQAKILKSPWFLWILIILGINPIGLVDPALNLTSKHLSDLARGDNSNYRF